MQDYQPEVYRSAFIGELVSNLLPDAIGSEEIREGCAKTRITDRELLAQAAQNQREIFGPVVRQRREVSRIEGLLMDRARSLVVSWRGLRLLPLLLLPLLRRWPSGWRRYGLATLTFALGEYAAIALGLMPGAVSNILSVVVGWTAFLLPSLIVVCLLQKYR